MYMYMHMHMHGHRAQYIHIAHVCTCMHSRSTYPRLRGGGAAEAELPGSPVFSEKKLLTADCGRGLRWK